MGKQYGVTPKGWREAAGDYGKAGSYMSVADVVDPGSLQKVRTYKKAQKAAAKETKAAKAQSTSSHRACGESVVPGRKLRSVRTLDEKCRAAYAMVNIWRRHI